jgi:hypothetical protein
MFKALFIATLLLSNVSVHSQEVDQSLVIASVKVTRIKPQPLVEMPAIPGNPIDEVAMYIDSLIAIGKKIWPIIDAGRPVINTTGIAPSISVLPFIEGTDPKAAYYEMANWSDPKIASYHVSYKNGIGKEVVGFDYTVYFQHSGDLNGKGKYITNLKVQATQVYAAWGFNFDAKSELVGIANTGSKDQPVASATIEISYKVRGLINEMRNAQTVYVKGTGDIRSLTK